jgi:hypothetical protein
MTHALLLAAFFDAYAATFTGRHVPADLDRPHVGLGIQSDTEPAVTDHDAHARCRSLLDDRAAFRGAIPLTM